MRQKEDVVEKVKSFTNNKGVDIIIDPVGSKNWKRSYKCLGTMGKLIIFGDQNGLVHIIQNGVELENEIFPFNENSYVYFMRKNVE